MKTTYAVYAVYAALDGEQWYENYVQVIGKFKTKAKNHSRAFHRYLNSQKIFLPKGLTYTDFDGDSYVIRIRKTDEPFYRATEILDDKLFY